MKHLLLSFLLSLLAFQLHAQTFYQYFDGELLPESQYEQFCDSVRKKEHHGKVINKMPVFVYFYINEVEHRGDSIVKHFIKDPYYGFTEDKIGKNPHHHLGEAFPDLELEDLDGNPLRISDFQGKKVFINFWFVTCPPCIAEMPDLERIRDKYEGDNVVFLSMAAERPKKVLDFLEKKQFDLRHIPNVKEVCKAIDLYYFPQSIILDEEGKIIRIDRSLEGFFEEEKFEALRADYERLLGN